MYREKYVPKLSIRTSLSNLRLDNGLLNIPLFALFNLEIYLSLSAVETKNSFS
jgi:hypothetical protein